MTRSQEIEFELGQAEQEQWDQFNENADAVAQAVYNCKYNHVSYLDNNFRPAGDCKKCVGYPFCQFI